MRFVVHPVGSGGDVNPLVGVGAALRRRGHEVVVLSGEPFRARVEGAGLELRSLFSAEEYHRLGDDPNLWHPTRGLKVVLDAVLQGLRPAYDEIAALYRPGETVLVGHALSFPVRIFEEKHGAPAATVHLAPSIFRSDFAQPVMPHGLDLSRAPRWLKRAVWRLADRIVDGVAAGPVNAFRAELGLRPVSRLFDRWIHSPWLLIGLFPDWFAPPQPDWPERLELVGFPRFDGSEGLPLEPALERFLAGGEPPIVFTPGTAHRNAAGFFRAAVEASARLGRRAILATSHAEHLPPSLPPGILHVRYAPFGSLLPRCAAVVHHGGIGTSSRGLQAGIPQLAMPMAFDQPDNAARLARLGVGGSLSPRSFTGRRVAHALDRLVGDPAVAEACRRAMDRTSGDGADRAADLLEQLGARTSDGRT